MNKETIRETVRRALDEAYRMREEDNRFYAELTSESDRGAAILAAEYFKERLGNAIKQKLSALDDGLWRRLEKKGIGKSLQSRFLGRDFATRIDIAYVLGLYSHETRERLNDIREIRNKFAHPSISEPLNFNTQWVVDRCKKLPLKAEPDPDSSRNRYVRYLSEVGDCVWSTLMELRNRTSPE